MNQTNKKRFMKEVYRNPRKKKIGEKKNFGKL